MCYALFFIPRLLLQKEKTNGNIGVLLICGGVNWDLVGRKVPPKSVKNACLTPINLFVPHRMVPEIRVRLIATGCNSCHSILVTEEGRALTFGRNDKGIGTMVLNEYYFMSMIVNLGFGY